MSNFTSTLISNNSTRINSKFNTFINISKIIKKLEAMAIQVSEGLSNAKEGMSKKALELKEYLESTRVVKAFRQMDIQYASLRIKTRTNQLKLSLQEFKNKIKEKISGE